MFVGILEVDLLLPDDVRSLKAKRSYVRGLVSELRNKLGLSVAEAGHQELLRRTLVGAAVVSADRGHARAVLEQAERLVLSRPEFEVISVRTRYVGQDDPGFDW